MKLTRVCPPVSAALSLLSILAFLVATPSSRAAEPSAGIPADFKLQYEQSFESPAALQDLVFSDPKAWRFSKDADTGSVELYGKSDYNPKDRSPFNIALVADKTFGDFILELELQSTVKPYPHQDMCVYFGFEATNKFYYTHIAVKPDPVKAESHAHDIFIVNNAPRLAIAKEVSNGVTWGENQWHKVRVERRLSDGSIKVYFDDMTKPIMQGTDKTFGPGFVGFGSFDDKGKITHVKIWAPSVQSKKTPFFSKLK